MGNQNKGDGPEDGLQRVGREGGEVFLYECGVALDVACERCKKILQTPSGHHSIEAEDDD